MEAVEPPSRNMAMVSFTPRPNRRSISMKMTDPTGRARNARENTAKESSVPSTALNWGNTTFGNTSTEAMA